MLSVSASELRNFCSGDFYIDWVKYVKKCPEEPIPEHVKYLFQKGNDFEDSVITRLRTLLNLPLEKLSSVKTSRDYDKLEPSVREKDLERTKKYMKNNEPVLYSAYMEVYDEKSGITLRGIPDLLIKRNFLHRLNESISQSSETYYVPVEIKFTSLYLNKNFGISNYGNIRYYKTQLFMYCKLLHAFQGYLPYESFILGRNNVMAHVNYFGAYDNSIVSTFYKAIEYLKNLKQNQPSFGPEFYPNMKVTGHEYLIEKKHVAEEIGEITSIFFCNIANREIAFKNGIYSRNHPQLTAELLQVPQHQYERVNRIIKVNRGEHVENKLSEEARCLLKKHPIKDCMFVDFETIHSSFLDINPACWKSETESNGERIFLIGVWYRGNYHPFLTRSLNQKEERRILFEFYDFWVSVGKPFCWYWFAEMNMWKRVQERQKVVLNISFYDLHQIFYENNIVLKNCFNYKLKSIIHAIEPISKEREEQVENGLDALFIAWKYYNESVGSLNEVLKYNELDCIYLEKLVLFLSNL